MFFKSIEMTGFKSFPDKIDLTFEKGITCVVGPNGSGKSNISDAIRWVMGEQSIKTLRGGKMEDVIFSGTQKRKPLGFCEVSLLVDNKDRGLNIDFDEVLVTRRIFRSGDSEYYINKSQCRLKDIQELFMDTGLGKDGYSLVGQGKIDNIIAGKPSERRTFFEEACGISKYHHKKDEAERKLNNTNDNITRLNDIINELEGQLEPLKIQSEKAKKFLVLRDELKDLEVNVWLRNYYEYKESLNKIEGDFENSKQVLENTKTTLANLDLRIEELSALSRDIQAENDRLVQENYNLEYNIKTYENQIEISKNNISHENENIIRIEGEKKELNEKISYFANNQEEITKNIKKLTDEKEDLESKVNSLTEKLNLVLTDINSHNSSLSELKIALAEKNTDLINLNAEKTSVFSLNESLKERLSRNEETIREKKEKIKELDKEVKSINERLDAIDDKEQEVKKKHLKLLEEKKLKEEEKDTYSDKINGLSNEIHRTLSRLDMLKDMESNFSGSPKGVKELLSVKPEKAELFGTFVSLIKTKSEYAKAIDSALGAAGNNIVCESEEDAKKSINYLKKNKRGRITFMPLTTVKSPSEIKENLKGEKGFIGFASELVSCDKKYISVMESMLLRVAVFSDMDSAVYATNKYKHSFKAVTLTGEIFNIGGSITGGEYKNSLGGLQRASEIETLTKKEADLINKKKNEEEALKKLHSEYEIILNSISETEEEKKQLNSKKIELLSSLKYQKELYYSITEDVKSNDEDISLVEEKIKSNNDKIIHTDEEIRVITEEIKSLEEQIVLKDGDFNKVTVKRDLINEEISTLKFEISKKATDISYEEDKVDLILKEKESCQTEIEAKDKNIAEIKDKIQDINDEILFRISQIEDSKASIREYEENIAKNKKKKEDTEKELNESQKSSRDLRVKFVSENEAYTKLEVKYTKVNSDIEQIVNNLWDSYELTISSAEELKKDIGALSTATRKISELKNKIKGLGNINIDAIEEYKRVSERYEFLTGQRDDLTSAKENLETIISDMVKLMKEIFTKQFKLIAESFNETYIELFGGGRGELKLTDPDNVLESGIEIEVQPPGKKLTTISLLSGGEKAFTAIALLFAIIKVKPTPFCLFDEIEAALDDNNVYRYADYLEKFKKDTQFIVITHRRGTMEAADTLYGVTMQEKGVSKLLSLNIDEVEQEGMKN